MRTVVSLGVLLTVAANGAGQDRVNAGAALDNAFLDRVAQYVKLRKSLEGGLPPPGADSGKEIAVRQQQLAQKIREARANARQGDIFSPEIAAEFRSLIALAMQGNNSTKIHKSMKSAEPRAGAPLAINAQLPDTLPMPSVPPTLLANLPRLTGDVDYRLLGRTLLLHDTKAGTIIDFIPDAVPAPK